MSISVLKRSSNQEKPEGRRAVDPRIIKEAGDHLSKRIDEFTTKMAREIGQQVKEMNDKR
jgi:hypothetical protein